MIRTVCWSFGITPAMLAALLFAGAWPVSASAAAATSAPPTVTVAQNTKLGDILTDSQGMTLYIFKKDKPGESVCMDACAKNWPPLMVTQGMQPMAASGISGTLGQIERKDGGHQVTYNGMPLYRFVKDAKPGDVNGQNVNGVWFVVQTSAAASAGSPAPKTP